MAFSSKSFTNRFSYRVSNLIGYRTSFKITSSKTNSIYDLINGVTENYIKSHEETAETFALLSYILGGISLLGLWANFKQKTFSNIVAIAILVFPIARICNPCPFQPYLKLPQPSITIQTTILNRFGNV